MRTSLKVLLALTMTAFFASCAYEADPGLTPKGGTEQKVDSLKGLKTTAEKLALKYGNKSGANGSAVAKCELTLAKVPAAKLIDAQLADDAGAPAPEPGLTLIGTDKFELDFNAQVELKEVKVPSRTVTVDGVAVSVDLKLAPLSLDMANIEKQVPKMDKDGKPVLDENKKPVIERHIYVMKYSPVLSIAGAATITANGVSTPKDVSAKANEKVLGVSDVVSTKLANGDSYQSSLSCIIETKVNDTNAKVKDELVSQWEDVNCGVAAPPKTAAAGDDAAPKALNPVCNPPKNPAQ